MNKLKEINRNAETRGSEEGSAEVTCDDETEDVVEDEDEGSDSNDKELQELEIERKGMKMGSNEETVGKPGKKKMSKGIFSTDWRGGMQTYINPAKIEGNGDGAEASKATVTVNTRSKRVRIFIEVFMC